MNKYDKGYCNGQVVQQCTIFAPASSVMETMSIFRMNLSQPMAFQQQLDLLLEAWTQWRNENAEQQPVFLRFFLSDIANQERLLSVEKFAQCAYSVIQQPPLDSNAKIALWCYSMNRMKPTFQGDLFTVQHGNYTHYWASNRKLTNGNSETQTLQMLEEHEKELQANGLTLADDCVRTWFFVQNVDVNYAGVVEGRKKNFTDIGLVPQTHYISSTGIEGRCTDPRSIVLMDAYSVKGLQKGQIQFLYAKDHLNPTYEYGVTFERGTKIKYGDRSHIFISGTASIDNKGNVLHIGDITRQVERMVENVDALLQEAKASFNDVVMAIIYLRDDADRNEVEKAFQSPDKCNIPKVFVHAPVCRPTWLVEMECIAMIHEQNSAFSNF